MPAKKRSSSCEKRARSSYRARTGLRSQAPAIAKEDDAESVAKPVAKPVAEQDPAIAKEDFAESAAKPVANSLQGFAWEKPGLKPVAKPVVINR